jgi:hypothetical protein
MCMYVYKQTYLHEYIYVNMYVYIHVTLFRPPPGQELSILLGSYLFLFS